MKVSVIKVKYLTERLSALMMLMILLMLANGEDGDKAYLGIFRRGQAVKT